MRKREQDLSGDIPIREIRLNTEEADLPEEEEYDEKPRPERRRNRNTELVLITWLFSVMFLLLAGYMVWFQVFKRQEITENVYNTKQDRASDRIIRGSIVTADGEQLAYTSTDYTGNSIRNYPYANVFAHAIGYSTNGRGGLEASLNSQLLSSHSSLISQLKYSDSSEKAQGDTAVVTFNTRLQSAAWNALGGYRGAVVVLEPSSGKILAMVSKPDFDPNTLGETWDMLMNDTDGSALLNRALQGLYPPGSTFKILTALAYLREHNNQYQDFQYNCEGAMTREDVTITCYSGIVHGQETLADAFANSCNTAFATIGLEIGNNDFRRLAEQFLFNRSLPLSLSHSQSVFSLNRDSSLGEQMTTAIGQGNTLVTPMHMAMIAATVANGGVMMRPYCVARIESADGNLVEETRPEIYDQLMTADEAQILTQCMRQTVEGGTGSALAGYGYSVAGKTGSAEYDNGETMGTHSWFVGFSDVEDPDIVVAVIAEDGGTGSSTAVPIAQQIFNAYYYG